MYVRSSACRDLVDIVKQTVPLWQEQCFNDGNEGRVWLPECGERGHSRSCERSAEC